jgi:hypothetical protein
MPQERSPLAFGTKTPWGLIQGMTKDGRERYYFLVSEGNPNAVAYMPAEVVERAVE